MVMWQSAPASGGPLCACVCVRARKHQVWTRETFSRLHQGSSLLSEGGLICDLDFILRLISF